MTSGLIQRVELFSGAMPVKTKFSFGQRSVFKFNILCLHAEGHVGFAEVIHPPSERLAALCQALLGQRADRQDDLLAKWRDEFPGYREMASLALHDLRARLRGAPLFRQLSDRMPPSPLPHLMPCIFRPEPELVRAEAERWCGQGYRALKIKLFGDVDQDVARIAAARGNLGSGFLQADLNKGIKSVKIAVRALPLFRDAGLDVIEDPLDGTLEDYRGLMEIPHRPKIMLDEPSRGDANLRRIAELRCCDVVNLHPNQQGTFEELRQRAFTAQAAGIDLEFGGTGFTGIGSWVWTHVALSHPTPYPIGEIGGALDHGMPASTAIAPVSVHAGRLVINDVPGHGGQLDHQVLRNYCTGYHNWGTR